MKSGRLSNNEKLLIQSAIEAKVPLDNICKGLDRTEKQVGNYIKTLKTRLEKTKSKSEKTEKLEKKISPKKRITAKDKMITRTSNKNEKGVTIMTPAAAEAGDEFNQKLKHTPKKNQRATYKIFDEDDE